MNMVKTHLVQQLELKQLNKCLLSIDLETDYNQLKIDLTETKSELKKQKLLKD